jgi:hypothetical protein
VDAAADLAEIEAIKQLKARYFRLLDTKDWVGWRQLFTDDVATGTDTAPPQADGAQRMPPRHADADAFVAFVGDLLRDSVTVHHGHMPEIELTGADTARGIWAMDDIVASAAATTRGYGHYHEEYRKRDGTWRIARMHLTRLRIESTPARPA